MKRRKEPFLKVNHVCLWNFKRVSLATRWRRKSRKRRVARAIAKAPLRQREIQHRKWFLLSGRRTRTRESDHEGDRDRERAGERERERETELESERWREHSGRIIFYISKRPRRLLQSHQRFIKSAFKYPRRRALAEAGPISRIIGHGARNYKTQR